MFNLTSDERYCKPDECDMRRYLLENGVSETVLARMCVPSRSTRNLSIIHGCPYAAVGKVISEINKLDRIHKG